MSAQIPPGRVETLSSDQELRLKQVWSHFLKHWGVPVDSAKVLAQENNQKPLSTTNTATSENKPKKGGSKLFGRFRKSAPAPKSEPLHKRTSSVTSQRSAESIESAYPHSLIHESLKNLKPEEVRENFWDMLRTDYPDNLLLRFLRARKWDTDKAMGMIAHTLHWRLKDAQPDDVIRGGEQAAYKNHEEGYVKNIELSKATIRGYDKKGRPIVLVRPKLHHASDQNEEEMKKYCLLIIEQARMFIREPVDCATILFDLTGFSLSNMDYSPVQYLITCFEAHYPECLGHLFIHKAPWVFPPIWNIIKNWLDPVVASKIIFTKNINDLSEHIPKEHIPEYLGGEDTYDFDSYQRPDEACDAKLSDGETREKILAERKEIIQRFIDVTVKWIECSSATESKQLLEEKIAISKELSKNYSQLDPYIRSRSVYDVNGTLKV
ncbi:LAFE_0E07470g1_1 [Lachancea fermentati]|uniref:LAFE_0E07470g1_1 n=1 Tax=Lachancea fermentati TaxID=4955 RepID=A0A1G4MDA2_LACFM|nr:LAFE_0E07470g1_1 [Lachancea fermentati]